MLRVCSLAGETLVALTAEEFEGQTVKSLKTLVGKQIGVPRFRQRWLGEDHTELSEDAFVIPSDVQLVVLDFAQAEDGDAEKLRDACEKNLLDEVEELLRKPMNPKMIDKTVFYTLRTGHKRTALHSAAENGHEEVVSLLLEASADKDAAISHGTTALHFAAGGGHVRVVRLLLESGADKDAAISDGWTALHWAAKNGLNEVVQLLLESGADKEAATSRGTTALHVAAEHHHLDAVRLLLEFGADKDAADSWGRTALHFAAGALDLITDRPMLNLLGDKETVRLLSEFGVDKDVADFDGMTALHLAAENGDNEVVQLLLESGANKEVATSNGWKRPLHSAAFNGHLEVVGLLLEAGTNKDATDSAGKTALHLAAERGHQQVVQLLEAESWWPESISRGEKNLNIFKPYRNLLCEWVFFMFDADAFREKPPRTCEIHTLLECHGESCETRLQAKYIKVPYM